MRTATCLWLIDVSIACGVTGGRLAGLAGCAGLGGGRGAAQGGGATDGALSKQHRFTLTFGARTCSPPHCLCIAIPTGRDRKWTDCTDHRPWCLFFSLRYSAAEWRNSLRRLCKLILSLPPGRFANWIWSVYWTFYSMRFVASSAERKDTLNFLKSRCKYGVFSHVRVSSLHFAN